MLKLPQTPKGRVAVYGGAALLILVAVYLVKRHRDQQDEVLSADPYAVTDDSSQAQPYDYGGTTISPITSGAAGGMADPGGSVATYTPQDILGIIQALQLPTQQPTPVPTPNPTVPPPDVPPIGEPAPLPQQPGPSAPSAPTQTVKKPCCLYNGRPLSYWKSNKRNGKWGWPDGKGYSHTQPFRGNKPCDGGGLAGGSHREC